MLKPPLVVDSPVLVHLKNPRPLGAVMSWRGFALKACVIEKIRGAKQKSGLNDINSGGG